MKKPNIKLIVNAGKNETRIAVVEDSRLSEVYIERESDRGVVSNIYKGKVVRVLPGMQASFVDIGLERAAFLYVSDFFDEFEDAFNQKEMEEEKRKGRYHQKIEDLVKEGQDVLVQVAKDPIGTKGARLTSHVSLPGRNLVFMPTVSYVGVSKKIESEEERKRLKKIIDENQTLEGGFIARTAAAFQDEKDIIADVQYLEKLWTKTLKRHQGMKAPALLHEELNLVNRSVRDLFTEDIEELVVDNKEAFRQIKQFVGQNLPKEKKQKISLHSDEQPIFDYYGLEKQLDQALEKKVWLKSGGYLIIEQTEALISVDVNTGKFVGSRNLEETVLKTNLEAAEEVVNQLRLRNLGGLIILDFIDMDRKSSRERVYRKLEEYLTNDKARTNVLQISELGLVEMTRKRTRESLVRMLCDSCSHCDGKGYHRSPQSIVYHILRNLEYEIAQRQSHENIELIVHPSVAIVLKREEYGTITQLENKTGRSISIREQASYKAENWQFNFTGHGLETVSASNKPSLMNQQDVQDNKEKFGVKTPEKKIRKESNAAAALPKKSKETEKPSGHLVDNRSTPEVEALSLSKKPSLSSKQDVQQNSDNANVSAPKNDDQRESIPAGALRKKSKETQPRSERVVKNKRTQDQETASVSKKPSLISKQDVQQNYDNIGVSAPENNGEKERIPAGALPKKSKEAEKASENAAKSKNSPAVNEKKHKPKLVSDLSELQEAPTEMEADVAHAEEAVLTPKPKSKPKLVQLVKNETE